MTFFLALTGQSAEAVGFFRYFSLCLKNRENTPLKRSKEAPFSCQVDGSSGDLAKVRRHCQEANIVSPDQLVLGS